ncbi:MAG: crossover junction endodeoxyribonuclease RuvC [Gammaproteobacteria bacterium]|nr:crossover junction endodeoxyribonuclease RuvC [Gammaproteobacteria bacterium]
MRILGIDPGFQATGFGIADTDGYRARHVCHGVIRVDGENLGERLRCIFRGIGAVLAEHGPAEVAVERVFMHRNADSALKLGQARGAAITACAERGLPVHEYTPNQIKQAIVGRGHAAKQQVQHMIRILLNLEELPQADAADALAIAICHGHFREGLKRMPGVTGMTRGRLR